MSVPKLTRSGIPIPFDAHGNEMCMLFMKFGRCRYKKRCKKSHWTPPLPVEEFPKPTSLSPLPPPLPGDDLTEITSTCTTGLFEPQSNKPSLSITVDQRCQLASADENIDTRNTRGDTGELHDEDEQVLSFKEIDIVAGNICPTPQVLRSGSSFSSTNKRIQLENSMELHYSHVLDKIQVSGSSIEEIVDQVVQNTSKGQSRFDHVYVQGKSVQDRSWRYKSSIDQTYDQCGAYLDNHTKKLEVNKRPQNKVEKQKLKLLRRLHWNTCQILKQRLAQLPPGYSLKVNVAKVDFVRLWPYCCLLLHKCFYTGPAYQQLRPSPFSCLVADTVIAFLKSGNMDTPLDVERKLQDWGGRPVRVRRCVSHLWSIIIKSSLSTTGVAHDIVACEKEVLAKKLSSVDYAYACYLAKKVVKGCKDSSNAMPLQQPPCFSVAVSKSVRQGIQASKRLLQQRKTVESLESKLNYCKMAASKTFTRTSSSDRKRHAKLKTKLMKKQHRRMRQLSQLDEKGRRDLMTRCKKILET